MGADRARVNPPSQARKIAEHQKKHVITGDASAAPLVWQKKIAKDIEEGASVKDFTKKAERAKHEERMVRRRAAAPPRPPGVVACMRVEKTLPVPGACTILSAAIHYASIGRTPRVQAALLASRPAHQYAWGD